MKPILTLTLILLISKGLFSQNNTDFQKLSKACELWGLIKYFHPDKPGNDFDSAFASNVPGMLEAKNENEWGNILRSWLSMLNDPNTNVIDDNKSKAEEGTYKVEFTSDSLLFIKISGIKLFEDYTEGEEFFSTVREELGKSLKGIIFDLRQGGKVPKEYKGLLNYYFNTIPELSTDVVPQYKTIYYSGFVPEIGTSSGAYTVSNVLRDAITVGDFQKRNQKVVWIVNKYSELPVVAMSQIASGVGIVLSDGGNMTDYLPLSETFTISGGIDVQFKTTDIILPANSHPITKVIYTEQENPVELSEKILSGWSLPPSTEPVAKTDNSDNTISYPQGSYPSVGYRILAAAKIFTVIETFFPYYDLMDKDWRNVLTESLPDFINARDDIEYGFAIAKMYANINDSHGFIEGNKGIAKLRGEAPSPVSVDWIENKIVVGRLLNDSICQTIGINIGDIILKVNGVSVDELMKDYEVYYAHSSKDPIRQTAARQCIRGAENEEGTFTIQDKSGKSKEVRFKWSNSYLKNYKVKYKQDTITLLNEKIGYADLTRMEVSQTDAMFEKFKDTEAIIFDMRGYPNGTAWSIAPRLTEKKNIPLALFRKPEILSPNIQAGDLLARKSYTEFIQTIAPSDKWKYKGKTVMLINQNAVSQSEHTGLFFESVNNTTFIGSPTVGANGDVTNFQVPGEMLLHFSGQGVWHVNNNQLQRVGLKPHVLVRPTIKGIREGKDEVLDKAIEWISKNLN